MDLICKICCENYTSSSELKRPRSLPCGHTLCGVCATRMLIGGTLKCYLCQRSYEFDNVAAIGINHELEDVMEWQASVQIQSGPKLHFGKCEEHGTYKVHHCQTHDVFICSDCAVAYQYHMEADCRRVPIKTVLNNRKADHVNKLESRMSDLQETCKQVQETDKQVKQYEDILKDTDLQIKAQIEKLQSEREGLQQQMILCKKYSTKYAGLITDSIERQEQTQLSINKLQNVTTFEKLSNETEEIDSSAQQAYNWTKQVKDTLKQECFGNFLLSGTIARLVTGRETYATHIHKGKQRWGRIVSKDGYILMQDFKANKLPTGSLVIDVRDGLQHLSSPRLVYLKFSTRSGEDLGMLIIEINEEAPRCARQFTELCLGQTGARYAGTTARVGHKGKASEFIAIDQYLTSTNELSDMNLYQDLEVRQTVQLKQGLVVGDVVNASFGIVTNPGSIGTVNVSAIGKVVLGLPVLNKIAEMDLSTSQVIISESGLVIDATHKKD